jgi:hypothetical protein
VTSYEVIQFLERLPKTGIIEILGSDLGLYLVASTCSYEALGDSGVIVTGKSGFGNIATVQASMLIDVNAISAIRHTRGTEQ